MKTLESCILDNTICEIAHRKGYTHILHDGVLYRIVLHPKYGFDWEVE